MGFDELKNKASDALGNEEQTDAGIEKGSDFLSEKTGGKYDEHLEKGTDAADDKLGGDRS